MKPSKSQTFRVYFPRNISKNRSTPFSERGVWRPFKDWPTVLAQRPSVSSPLNLGGLRWVHRRCRISRYCTICRFAPQTIAYDTWQLSLQGRLRCYHGGGRLLLEVFTHSLSLLGLYHFDSDPLSEHTDASIARLGTFEKKKLLAYVGEILRVNLLKRNPQRCLIAVRGMSLIMVTCGLGPLPHPLPAMDGSCHRSSWRERRVPVFPNWYGACILALVLIMGAVDPRHIQHGLWEIKDFPWLRPLSTLLMIEWGIAWKLGVPGSKDSSQDSNNVWILLTEVWCVPTISSNTVPVSADC